MWGSFAVIGGQEVSGGSGMREKKSTPVPLGAPWTVEGCGFRLQSSGVRTFQVEAEFEKRNRLRYL